MKFTEKKLLLILVFMLSSISILRLLKNSIVTLSSSSPLLSVPPILVLNKPVAQQTLSEKEFQLLSNLISQKAPCNILVFGLEMQYLKLASINAEGHTIFLEDNSEKIAAIRRYSNNIKIYQAEYNIPARDAYKQLTLARHNQACAPNSGPLKVSTCALALTKLPQEVYEKEWDVIVVDGPSGHSLEASGRMAVIYTAGYLARSGTTTHVIVHDVDRTVEKWFSWEFLCDENLVSCKGKMWNFRIDGRSNITRFCSDNTVIIK